MLDSQGPSGERKGAKAKSGEILKRLGHKNLKLTEYEGAIYSHKMHYSKLHDITEVIASEVVHPDDIDVKFSGEKRQPYENWRL